MTRLATDSPVFTGDSRPCVVEGVIVDRDGADVFLLHPELPRWALTDSFGLALAEAFDGNRSIGELAAMLAARYAELERDQAERDLARFASDLQGAGLLASHPLDDSALPPSYEEPRRLSIYLTEECNLRCKHCFVVEGKMPRPTLSTGEIEALIDAHLARHPGAFVVFTGGEPLLRDDCIPLVRYAALRTPSVSINTNALLVDDSVIEAMRDYPGFFLQVSLDGVTEEVHDFVRGKGTFRKTWGVLERLAGEGLAGQVRTSTTLMRCNLDEIRTFIARLDPLGLERMRFLMLNKLKAADTWWRELAPEPEDLKAIYRYLVLEVPRLSPPVRTRITGDFPGFVPQPDPRGRHWCPMGKTSIVDSLGNAYTCPVLHTPDHRVGKLGEDDLEKIENGLVTAGMREKMLSRRHRIDECRACAWRNFCQGGCQGIMQLRTGSAWTTDGFCDFRRELYRDHARGRGGAV